MRKVIALAVIVLSFNLVGISQTANTCTVPTGFVCLTQEAANRAAAEHRENVALTAEVATLKDAIVTHEKNEADLKASAVRNESALKEQLTKTQVDLALKTGELVGKEAELTRNTAIMDILIKNTRKKCMPFSFCI